MKTHEALEALVDTWNACRADGIRAHVVTRSCLFGRGFVCDCCPRKSVGVLFRTDRTRGNVAATLVSAARDFRALLPADRKVTRAKSAQYVAASHCYGPYPRLLGTTFRIDVLL